MGRQWGIADTVPESEKIKSEFSDFINRLNSTYGISYEVYCELFDFTMQLLDEMFELGSKQNEQ